MITPQKQIPSPEMHDKMYAGEPTKKHLSPFVSIVSLVILLGGAAYGSFWYWQNMQLMDEPVPALTPRIIEELTYKNNEYGFTIPLTNEWEGYLAMKTQWQGTNIATGRVIERGPIITLRHPKWTTAAPREDMPVMIFTPAQWNLVKTQKISLGAAPIAPTILGQNSKYILALPARYNYDFKAGWEEVDQLVHKLKAFELDKLMVSPCPSGQLCE
ncbi:hypothetical protein KW791_02245 [Candidatus Parcubacteria bacterium]|nr:hypothetical protein [Candidatus Parcubacteria bacterium]